MLKEVTKDEYYKSIGPLDVIGSIVTRYPYTIIHANRSTRSEIGRSVDFLPEGKQLTETKYFLRR